MAWLTQYMMNTEQIKETICANFYTNISHDDYLGESRDGAQVQLHQ